MNTNDVFALSNNPSKTAFQPIPEEDNQLFNLQRRPTPTTLTFKSSKAISKSIELKKEDKENKNLDYNLNSNYYLDDQLEDDEELYKRINKHIKDEDQPSSNSEPLPFQDCTTSRSNSNCSSQSLFSDELSCSLTFNSTTTLTKNQLDSSIDTSSLNKHLLISDKHSPQLLIGSQLPPGICCVLSSKPSISSIKQLNENLELFNRIDEVMSPEQDSNKQDNLELLELPKQQRTKKKHKLKLKNRASILSQFDSTKNQQLNELINNQELLNNDNKPQLRFTRYDTVETEDGSNHLNLLAIDHLPSQMVFQDHDIANLNQARLIKTNLIKQKSPIKNLKQHTSQMQIQPTINNQQLTNLSNIPNLSNNFAILPNSANNNKFGLIINPSNQGKCNCNELKNEINNNTFQRNICLDCENTKKILQSNLVQLIPIQSCSTSNNTSPLSIQISPISLNSSIHSASTCSAGQLNSAISNSSVPLQNFNNNNNILSATINQQKQQSISAPINSNQGNAFNYDTATIQQYAMSLNNQQERTISSLSGFSDPLSQIQQQQQINQHLPSIRSASSCAQYHNIVPSSMQEYNRTQFNQFQPINSNISKSEQNLMSNRCYNSINNFNVNNQTNNQRQQQQFYSQQHIYNGSPNQLNNRPYRLSFRTPSPLLTSSSLASPLESPSATYIDNNDSVNIFNKYQTTSSYFYKGPKKHDFFRKAIPALPLFLAVILCLLNWFIPGSGTLLSSLAVLFGAKTEHGRSKWKMAFLLNILAGTLQFLTAIIVFGWVWSVFYGIYFIKCSLSRSKDKDTTAPYYV